MLTHASIVFVSFFPHSIPGNLVPKPRHRSIAGAFYILHATDFPGYNAASGSAPTPPAALPPSLLSGTDADAGPLHPAAATLPVPPSGDGEDPCRGAVD